jgi:hypothetical protein
MNLFIKLLRLALLVVFSVVLGHLHAADGSAFVTDVTVPDNTAYLPGASFNKTWRLRNTGTTPRGLPPFDSTTSLATKWEPLPP